MTTSIFKRCCREFHPLTLHLCFHLSFHSLKIAAAAAVFIFKTFMNQSFFFYMHKVQKLYSESVETFMFLHQGHLHVLIWCGRGAQLKLCPFLLNLLSLLRVNCIFPQTFRN